MSGNRSASPRGGRRWLGWWLAWTALCCALAATASAAWPRSAFLTSVPAVLAVLGSSLIGHLHRRHRPAGRRGGTRAFAAIAVGATLAALVLTVPVVRAFIS